MKTKQTRGIGYCENTNCLAFAKGSFLLPKGEVFYCFSCRCPGKIEKERGFYTGNTDIFKEVRVEYNFDSINNVYHSIAIIQDESINGIKNIYTLQSPLISTESRAMKVAEALLANLTYYQDMVKNNDIPQITEMVLSFDDSPEVFSQKLQHLSKEWGASTLCGEN